MKKTTVNVVIVEPDKRPYTSTIIKNINAIKEIVGSNLLFPSDIDVIKIDDNIFLIHNTEGALLGLRGNRKVKNDIIAGTFLVVQTDRKGKITSISNSNSTKYIRQFWNAEQYTDKEVSNAYWNKWVATTDDID